MQRTKQFLVGGLFAIAVAGMVGATASAMPTEDPPPPPPPVGCAAIDLPAPTNANKVTLCHFTGSDSNPFIVNEVSGSAASSHSDHHGDCVRPATGPTVCVL